MARRSPRPLAQAALLAALALGLMYLLRWVLLPFVLSAYVAYVAWPAVRTLRRRGVGRVLSSIIVLVVLLGLLGGGCFWAYHQLLPQLLHAAHQVPHLIEHMRQASENGNLVVFGFTLRIDGQLGQWRQWLTGWLSDPGLVLGIGKNVAYAGIGVVLALVLLVIYLVDGRRLIDRALWLVPPARREAAGELLAALHRVLWRYVAGMCVIFLFAIFVSWLVFRFLLHLPDPALLAVITGVLEAVPVVGPIIAVAIAASLAIAKGGLSLGLAYGLFGLVLRLVIDQVLGPLVLGRAMRLHPVVILLAFAVGGTLLGVLGLLIAIPVAASAKTFLESYYARRPPH